MVARWRGGAAFCLLLLSFADGVRGAPYGEAALLGCSAAIHV